MNRFITIDSEGYLCSQGTRWTDASLALPVLKTLHRNKHGAWQVTTDQQDVFVEAFDQPLIVQSLEPNETSKWTLIAPYGYKAEFDLSKIVFDEWDRILGRTTEDITFAFSRQAQEIFFNSISSIDDEGFEHAGKRYVAQSWPFVDTVATDLLSHHWDEAYIKDRAAWDLGSHHPSLPDIHAQLKLSRCRILVLGCGQGHDAAFFAQQGHFVTAVDFSPVAIERAKKLYSNVRNLNFAEADALKLPEKFRSNFDLVFEHTLYPAILPSDRNALVKSWRSALTDQGQILAIFTLFDKSNGPPFASNEFEIKKRLQSGFRFLYWTRNKTSPPRRLGQELIFFGQKI